MKHFKYAFVSLFVAALMTAPLQVEASPKAAQTPTPQKKLPDTLIAQATVSQNECMPGDSVTFDGSPTNDPDRIIESYSWEFSDGHKSNSKVVRLSFDKAGDFTATLIIIDKYGRTSKIVKTFKVKLPALPEPQIAISPLNGNAPLTMTFDGSQTADPNKIIQKYSWKFSDGRKADGKFVHEDFKKAGDFSASLTIVDKWNRSASVTKSFKVNPEKLPDLPTPKMTISPVDGNAPVSVTFDASTTSDPSRIIKSYKWQLSDGRRAEGKMVRRAFEKAGQFTATLTIVDKWGRSAKTQQAFRVEPTVISSVTVAVKEVDIYDTVKRKWIVLNQNRQNVDLMVLAADARPLLTNNSLPLGTYDQFRLKLSKDDAVAVINGKPTKVDIPKIDDQLILKAKAPFTIAQGPISTFTLDFDPNKNIRRDFFDDEHGRWFCRLEWAFDFWGHHWDHRQNDLDDHYILSRIIAIKSITETPRAPAGVAPTISITSPLAATTNLATQTIQVQYADADNNIDLNSLSIKVDGVEVKSQLTITTASASGTLTFSEGTHQIQASILDLTNKLATAMAVSFVVDLTAPTVLLSESHILTNNPNPILSANISDTLTGLDLSSLAVLIDDVDAKATLTTSGSLFSIKPNLTEGNHTFSFSIRDLAGNLTTASGDIRVDLTPPAIALAQSNILSKTSGVVVNADIKDLQSGLDPATLVIEVDGVDAKSTLVTTGSTYTISPTLSEGNHTFSFSVKDLVGNASSATGTIRVDVTQPSIVLAQSNILSKTSSVAISADIKDLQSGLDPSSLIIEVDGINARSTLVTIGSTYTISPMLTEGDHTFKFSVQDLVGNSSSATGTVRVDLTPPSIALAQSNILSKTSHVAISADIKDLQTGLDPASLQIEVDGVDAKSTLMTTGSTYTISPILTEGDHTFKFSVRDLVGNSSSASGSVRVDLTAPSIVLSQSDILSKASNVVISASITDSLAGLDPATLAIEIDGADTKSTLQTSGSTYTISPTLAEGDHTFSFSIKDMVGNSSSATGHVRVDTTAPVLTQIAPAPSSIYYTATFPVKIDVRASSNENLISASINGAAVALTDSVNFSGQIQAQSDGTLAISLEGTDLAGNVGTVTSTVQIIQDSIAPAIQLGLDDQTKTKLMSVDIPISISDTSPAWTTIKVNGEERLQTGATNFTFSANLDVEGANLIEVSSEDSAGNISTTSSLHVIRDTTAPIISLQSPLANSSFGSVILQIQGTSNEPLGRVEVDGLVLTISDDKLSFSGQYVAAGNGNFTLHFTASDTVGNTANFSTTVTIATPLLVHQLVSVVGQDSRVLVVGAAGAARPGITVSASAGMLGLNSDSMTVGTDGSFVLSLSQFSSATLKAKDQQTGETDTMALQFTLATGLAGIVKDVDDNPLPNATIRIVGTSLSTTTSGTGSFSFTNVVTGDQFLEIDGTTIPQSVTGPNKAFVKVKLAVNIGVGQANILSKPIYLTPLISDGTETTVVANVPANVTSSHAPGVTLNIAANSATFPASAHSNKINMMTVATDKATIPPPLGAVPAQVVSLEPSGLVLSARTPISFPNYYQLPPGSDMVLFSMNSTKGVWEVDGMATVSSDGGQIVSKANEGISHFSLVYAMPIAPTTVPVLDPNIKAYSSNDAGSSTEIDMPSFKFGDESISPKLIYRSTWARPKAFVSNLIDIPQDTISFSHVTSASSSDYVHIRFDHPCNESQVDCDGAHGYENWYVTTFYNLITTTTSWYVPDSITSQFFVGSNSTASIELAGSNLPDEINNLFSSSCIDGVCKSNGDASGDVSAMTVLQPTNSTLPEKNLVSYAVDLLDPSKTDGSYLPSGLYPTLARYQVKIRNFTSTSSNLYLTRNSVDTGYTTRSGRAGAPIPNADRTLNASFINSSLQSTVLQQALPQDVAANLVVQNKVKSPGGRGWHIAGPQTILNPDGADIVIEESNGSVNTYEISNTIETLNNASLANMQFDQGFDLSQFPTVTGIKIDSQGLGKISQFPTNSTVGSPIDLAPVPQVSGYIGDDESYNCVNVGYAGSFTPETFAFITKPTITSIVRLSNGDFYGTDALQHSVFKISNGVATQIAGFHTLVQPYNMPDELIRPDICTSLFGNNCSAPVSRPSRPCTDAKPPVCPPHVNCGIQTAPTFWPSVGIIGQPEYFGDGDVGSVGQADATGLNTPMGIVVAPDGSLIIADSGNNVIRRINLSTNTITTIAGNGANGAFPLAGGSALQVPIFHPRGLLYDDAGNLFISTESGYILRLKTDNTIEWIGGLPIGQGVFANQAHFSTFALSSPFGMAFDSQANALFIADTGFNRVVRVDLASKQAVVIAGDGTCTLATTRDDVPATATNICSPTQVLLDSDKNLIVLDSGHKSFRRVIFDAETGTSLSFTPVNQDGSDLSLNADKTWTRTYRDGSVATFDVNGRQTSSKDPAGRITQFNYDTNGRFQSMVLSTGQTVQYQYDGSGFLSKIIDPAGRSTAFDYSGDQLSKVHFPDGSSKSFRYNNDNLMSQIIDQLGKTRGFEYTPQLRLAATVLEDNSRIAVLDSVTRTLQPSDQDAISSLGLGFDDGEVKTTYTDAAGRNTNVITDIRGQPAFVLDAMNFLTGYRYDINSLLTEVTRANGLKVKFTYDTDTRDLTKAEEELSPTQTRLIASTSFDSAGHIVSSTDARGMKIINTYNGLGQLIRKARSDGSGRIDYGYDSNGFVSNITIYPSTSSALTTTYDRNGFGWVTKITLPDGKYVQFTYDNAGNELTRSTSIDGTTTVQSISEYDSMNRITSRTSGKGDRTSFSYDAKGNQIVVTDPDGKATTYQYDSLSRFVSSTDSTGATSSVMYDGVGNVISETDPDQTTTAFGYDALDRMVSAQLPDDQWRYDYYFDSKLLSGLSNKVSQMTYTRNNRGWIIGESNKGLGAMASYPVSGFSNQYYDNGLLSSCSTDYGTITYGLDSNNRLQSLISVSGSQFNFGWDGADRMTSIARPGSSTALAYSDSSAVSSLQTTSASGLISSFGYQRDGRNLITQRSSIVDSATYGYDKSGHLTSAVGPENNSFSYDQNGNRTSDSSGNFAYNAKGQLNSDARFSYVYDINGNLSAKSPLTGNDKAFQYTYNSQNQLVQVIVSAVAGGAAEKVVSFQYDVRGRRMEKRVQDNLVPSNSYVRRYIYRGSNPIAQVDESGTLLAKYSYSPFASDDLLEVQLTSAGVNAKLGTNAGHSYVLKDALNSVSDVVNSTGNILQRNAYSSFGQILSIKDAGGTDISNNPSLAPDMAFTAREWDSEIGLYYYRSRYYDPQVGRFISKDPLGRSASGASLYSYAFGNPTNYTDPSGARIIDLTGGIIPNIVKFSDVYRRLDSAVEEIYITVGPLPPISPKVRPDYGRTESGDWQIAYDKNGVLHYGDIIITMNDSTTSRNADSDAETVDTYIHELSHAESFLSFGAAFTPGLDHLTFTPMETTLFWNQLQFTYSSSMLPRPDIGGHYTYTPSGGSGGGGSYYPGVPWGDGGSTGGGSGGGSSGGSGDGCSLCSIFSW